MQDYKEQVLTGKKWQRCSGIHFNNDYGDVPLAHFREEVVALMEDGSMVQPVPGASMQVHYDEKIKNIEFDLLDPTTHTFLGKMTVEQVYLALYGLYLHMANIRDVEKVPVDIVFVGGPTMTPGVDGLTNFNIEIVEDPEATHYQYGWFKNGVIQDHNKEVAFEVVTGDIVYCTVTGSKPGVFGGIMLNGTSTSITV